uniref:Uncharacterized protein n=1 Tax=Paramormyrops kingsleyae TaxID=1676925 RepID=A0A3B3RI61_9TELE
MSAAAVVEGSCIFATQAIHMHSGCGKAHLRQAVCHRLQNDAYTFTDKGQFEDASSPNLDRKIQTGSVQ